MIFSISYDLKKPDRDYAGPIRGHQELRRMVALSRLNMACRPLKALNADGIWNKVKSHVDANDYMLIVGITADKSGGCPRKLGIDQ